MKSPLSGLKNRFFPTYGRTSYSQEGEDILISRLLSSVERGFYVDIGAHHPKRFSNTYFFYRRNWAGINVDAMPGSMAAFERTRPRDRNLEVAVAEEAGKKTFFLFNDPALNTFDESLIPSRLNAGYRIVDRITVQARRLDELLTENLPVGQKIHFLTIDVEGLDLQVLRSNDWKNFRPEFVLAECLGSSFSEIENNPVYLYLKQQDYVFCAKTMNTFFFKNAKT
jgi:FkbM family methyltransferase